MIRLTKLERKERYVSVELFGLPSEIKGFLEIARAMFPEKNFSIVKPEPEEMLPTNKYWMPVEAYPGSFQVATKPFGGDWNTAAYWDADGEITAAVMVD